MANGITFNTLTDRILVEGDKYISGTSEDMDF